MAMDIEKLIQEKKTSLDVENPPESIWEAIEKDGSWQKQHTTRDFQWMWKAAAVALLITRGVLLTLLVNRGEETSVPQGLADISTYYKEIEQDYQQNLEAIEENLEIKQVHRDEFPWLFEELEILEEVNEEYKAELAIHGDKDLVVKALIDYYEKKLKILKRIELEINRKNNERNEAINI